MAKSRKSIIGIISVAWIIVKLIPMLVRLWKWIKDKESLSRDEQDALNRANYYFSKSLNKSVALGCKRGGTPPEEGDE